MAAAPSSSPFAIGIDLGTTFSCAAVWRNKDVEIIQNGQGFRTTPSVVSFTKDKRLVGKPAKSRALSDPENTLYDVKRLIGHRFSDPIVQEEKEHWPFRVIDVDGLPHLQISRNGQTFAPEVVSSMILAKLKEDAETYLGREVKDAVITCPAYFNDTQRAATKNAGLLAGLNVLQVLNEPTAAAIAYGINNRDRECNILVYDFGGGTLDVSLMTMSISEKGPVFIVKAVAGDTHLGGDDLVEILVKYLVDEVMLETGRNVFADAQSSSLKISKKAKQTLSELRVKCEEAKCSLSDDDECTVYFDYGGEDFEKIITRARFEDLCKDTFARCMKPLERVLSETGMRREDVNEVILVGGSTRIPRIKKMVSDFFGGRVLNQTINPDEAVAKGAAIQACIIAKEQNPEKVDAPFVQLFEKTSLSLGIECGDDKRMVVVVPRKTSFPCRIPDTFTTKYENQSVVEFRVFEGEDSNTAGNHCLGKFELTNIPPAPRGVPQFEVIFEIDRNGILIVSARDVKTGERNQIRISDQGRLSQEEINKMIREGKK